MTRLQNYRPPETTVALEISQSLEILQDPLLSEEAWQQEYKQLQEFAQTNGVLLAGSTALAQAVVHFQAQAQARAWIPAREPDLARVQVLEQKLAMELDRVVAQELAIELNRALARELNLNLALKQEQEQRLAQALDLVLKQELELTLARELNHPDLELERKRALERDLKLDLELERKRALEQDLKLDLELELELDLELEQALAWVRVRALESVLDWELNQKHGQMLKSDSELKLALNQAQQARREQLVLSGVALACLTLLVFLIKLENPTSLTLTGQLWGFLPEEYVAELGALHDRLQSQNHSTWLIRLIMLWCFLELFWAFYIQIKIENIGLPQKGDTKRIDE